MKKEGGLPHYAALVKSLHMYHTHAHTHTHYNIFAFTCTCTVLHLCITYQARPLSLRVCNLAYVNYVDRKRVSHWYP